MLIINKIETNVSVSGDLLFDVNIRALCPQQAEHICVKDCSESTVEVRKVDKTEWLQLCEFRSTTSRNHAECFIALSGHIKLIKVSYSYFCEHCTARGIPFLYSH